MGFCGVNYNDKYGMSEYQREQLKQLQDISYYLKLIAENTGQLDITMKRLDRRLHKDTEE